MKEFIVLFRDFMMDVVDVLAGVWLSFGTMTVNLASLLFAFMVTGIVITVFWRGAKT